MSHLLLFVAAASIAVSSCAGAPAPAYDLAVEYVVQHTDPVTGKRSQGPLIDIPDPRFSWVPVSSDRGAVQASYRIIVNKTDAAISTTVWDSGITSSNATSQVVYGGSPLVSSGSYSWSVLWTDGTGAASGWAEPASFSTGLLTQGEWAPAAFITCGDTAANQLRAEFIVPPGAGGVALVDAQLLITGMGYYRAFINGARLGRTELDPAWTTYPQRLLYSGYNVLSLLSPAGAPSALAVYLGNGWPNISPNPFNSSVDAGDAGFADGAAVAAALDAAGAAAQSLYAEAHPGAEPVSAVAALRLTGGLPPLRGIGAVRKLRAQLRLTYADGSIAVLATTAGGFADASAVALKAMGATPVPATWRCAAGALTFDDVYDGCTWDARAETVGWDLPGYAPAAAWPEAVLASDPGGVHGPAAMTAQTMPPVSIVAMLPALTVNEPSPGVFVLDFGQNFAGYVRLRYPAPVPAGVNITLRHAELLQHPPYGPKDGSVYTGNLRSAKATDVYTTRASPDDDVLFEPLFTYHGFRYVEVSGMPLPVTPDMLTGLVFRSAVAPAGALTFPAGGDAPGNVSVLNQLQHAVTWGQASNLMSVPSDCPQRDERKGWMGDSGLSQETMHMNFRMCAFHTKWAADQRDAQTAPQYAHPVGAVPDTVPWTFGGDPGDPAWMTSYPGAVYWLWRHCGDTRAPAAHWPNMRAYVDFQWATLNGTAGGMKNYYSHYSDWCPPPEQPGGGQGAKPSGAFTSASAFVGDVAHLIELADALGEVADAATWRGLHATLVSEYNTAFYNAGSANYGNANGDGLQTANSIALALGVVPTAATSAVAAALDHDVTTVHGGHWFTGISGMRFLCRALTAAGFGKTAVDLLLPLDYPSFGFWFNNADEPATTMNELPDMSTEGPGMNSRNHHMFSSVGAFLYDLAGLRLAPGSIGWRSAWLWPAVVDHPSLQYASGSYESEAGRFTISWSVAGASATCVAGAAENTQVTLKCPGTGNKITAITFASFGTPTGSCEGGFSKGACDASNSSSAIAALCVGQRACTIDVSTTFFGDPCYDTVKTLDVAYACSSTPDFASAVTVPVAATATVVLPFSKAITPAAVTVTEGGTTVWVAGSYVPGVPGITGAQLISDIPAIAVAVGSGDYSFALESAA